MSGSPRLKRSIGAPVTLDARLVTGPSYFGRPGGFGLCVSRTDNKQSRKLTEELTSLARRLGDESLLLEAQHCRWGDEALGGNVPQILETTEEGIRRYDAKRHAQLADAFGGHDPGVCALVVHAVGLSLRGLPDQARRTMEKAFALAESLSHPPSIGFAHRYGGSYLHDTSRPPRLRADRRALRGACGEVRPSDLPRYWPLPYGLGESARAYLVGRSRFDGRGFSFRVNEHIYKFFGAALAEARFDAGRVTDALALVDHALNTGEGPASGLYVPEIHRLRGTFLKSLGSPVEEVERALLTALEIAEEQGAFLLKLRASTSLARLWRDQGKVQRSARTAGSGLWVVHGGLRHARSEGGEGAAGGVGLERTSGTLKSCKSFNQRQE